jgi:hypothetical protein
METGLRRYQVLRSVDGPHYVMIDLEFDTTAEAETEALLAKMREIWKRMQGAVMSNL